MLKLRILTVKDKNNSETILGANSSDETRVIRTNDSGQMEVDIAANAIGIATSANQLPNGHNVTANAGTNLNTSLLATSVKQDNLLTELQAKADLSETFKLITPLLPLEVFLYSSRALLFPNPLSQS